MIRDKEIIATVGTIKNNLLNELTTEESLLVLSNLILIQAINYLPPELKNNSTDVLSSGKRIVYEQLEFENNYGLTLGLLAHRIIEIANKINDKYV